LRLAIAKYKRTLKPNPITFTENGIEQFLNPVSRRKVARTYRRHFDHLALDEFHLLVLKKAQLCQAIIHLARDFEAPHRRRWLSTL
jgi:hypothetical protein